MQLGRSYYRRLKSVKYEIYELYPSARHAYLAMKPAVKTSRPQVVFKERTLIPYKLPFRAGKGEQRYIKKAIFVLPK